jgi:hypothetical protein
MDSSFFVGRLTIVPAAASQTSQPDQDQAVRGDAS